MCTFLPSKLTEIPNIFVDVKHQDLSSFTADYFDHGGQRKFVFMLSFVYSTAKFQCSQTKSEAWRGVGERTVTFQKDKKQKGL